MSDKLIDIVVLVHDQASWLDLCVRAIEAHTKNPYRLIVVDNASVELKTSALLKEIEDRGHTVLRLSENRSFSNGINAGVATGSAKFIAIVNSDAIVQEGWDAALLQDANVKHIGLVGARSNYAAGPCGDPSFLGEPPFIVFVTVMLRREVWNQIGPLDEENFDGFSSEDLDYSWRVKKAGFQLKVGSAYVLHAGSKTLTAKVGDAEARARNDAKYAARLIQKHGQEWYVEKTKLRKKVLVASFSPEEWTRVDFMRNLLTLKRGDGVAFSYYHHTRSPIQVARQAVSDYALNSGFDWLVMLDDDAQFPSDLLNRLLKHDKDIVTAIAYQRMPPHGICIFQHVEPGAITGTPMEGIEHTGLRQIDVSGLHCSAIKTSVFKRLKDAGITQYYGGFENKVGEDFAFFNNCKKAGIAAYCDTDLISGHLGSSIVVDEAYKRAFVQGQAQGSAKPLIVRP